MNFSSSGKLFCVCFTTIKPSRPTSDCVIDEDCNSRSTIPVTGVDRKICFPIPLPLLLMPPWWMWKKPLESLKLCILGGMKWKTSIHRYKHFIFIRARLAKNVSQSCVEFLKLFLSSRISPCCRSLSTDRVPLEATEPWGRSYRVPLEASFYFWNLLLFQLAKLQWIMLEQGWLQTLPPPPLHALRAPMAAMEETPRISKVRLLPPFQYIAWKFSQGLEVLFICYVSHMWYVISSLNGCVAALLVKGPSVGGAIQTEECEWH